MAGLLRCLLIGVVLVAVNGAVPADEVSGEDLPGWNKPLRSKQYSGYIDLNDTYGKSLHYWFVESESSPETAPVVMWMNGGPGCSSMDGYFNEMGPLHFNRRNYTTGLPQLMYNPWTWTKVVNMLFLEAPAGVGFSYASDPKGGYIHDDNTTADDNYSFLVKWFEKFPEYCKNDLYITGESYAGIYVPTLVNKIRVTSNMINLKGFAVGNGCIGSEVGGCSGRQGTKIHIEFYHNHALFSDIVYNDIVKYCGDYERINEECEKAISKMRDEIGKVNIYDIYDECSENLTTSYKRAGNPFHKLFETRKGHLNAIHDVGGPFDCIDDHVERAFFNDPKVRDAIHVLPLDKLRSWTICTSKIDYSSNIKSLLPIYPTLIDNYHTLIYNGDVDGCVPYIGNEQWTSGLGLPVKKPWSAWMVDDQVAGYITEYEAKTSFRFVTIKGAGHMVPQYQPKFAYSMLQQFILN